MRQLIFNPQDGRQHWIYVGVVPPSFAPALRGFFRAFARATESDPGLRHRVSLHFVGTSYASGDRAQKSVEPIAREFGVHDCVTEHPQRIPYFEALRCLLDADAMILFGSEDPSYVASKLMPCVYTRKPMLAIFHEESPVVTTLRFLDAGTVVTFRAGASAEELGEGIFAQWFLAGPEAARIPSDEKLAPYTAERMTERLVDVFNAAAFGSHEKFAGKPD